MSEEPKYTKADSIKETDIWKTINEKDAALANVCVEAARFVEPHLECYKILFPHYTDHSITHSFNVMNSMYNLMSNPSSHSTTELFFCIYAALFHDIGMLLEEDEKNNEINGTTEKYISRYVGNGESAEKKKKEREITLQNKIRVEHGNRVEHILDKWYNEKKNLFSIDGNSIVSEISAICKSHMQTVEEVQDLPKTETTYNQQYSPLYVAVLLRIADAIDFSPDRAPTAIYQNYNISDDSNSNSYWQLHKGIKGKILVRKKERNISVVLFPKNLKDWLRDNKDKTEDDYQYVLSNVYSYYQWLEREIIESISLLDDFSDSKYWIPAKMQFSEDSKQFNDYIPNFRIKTNYEAVVSNLLGTGLYGEPRVGLREIIQNSIDACKWRACRENGYETGMQPTIEIIIDECEKYEGGNRRDPSVRIIDNGIGMSLETVKTCFLGIGNSIYNNPTYELSKEKFDHIGKHGIGFFATFMLSDKVRIRTRHIDSKDEIKVVVTSWQENALVQRVKSNPIHIGTEIILRDVKRFKEIFKPCCDEEANTAQVVCHYLENIFLNDCPAISFKIKQIGRNGEIVEDISACEILTLQEKVNQDLGQIESLTEHFSQTHYNGIMQHSIEGFACFDSGFVNKKLFIWDDQNKNFVENENWQSLNEGEAELCTISLYDQRKSEIPIVLCYPNSSYTLSPFGLINQRYREKTYYKTSIICREANTTIDEFFAQNKIGNVQYPFGAFVEKISIKIIAESVFLLRKNADFENSSPKTRYVKSGKTFFDKVYARNVFIPKAHLKAPVQIIAIDGVFSGEIKDIIINIKSNKIYPTLKRDNLSAEDIEKVSYAVSRALMIRQIKQHPSLIGIMDSIVKQFFGENNIFIEEE